MDLYGLQLDIAWEEPAANFQRVRNLLAGQRPAPGSLLLLPEMFATGFSMNVPALAAAAPQIEAFLTGLARDYQIFLVAGLATQESDGKGRNEALILDPAGRALGRYAKMHPFSAAREHEFFRPGDRLCPFQWAEATVTPVICYDLRFPELFRAGVRAGTEVFLVMASWPAAREDHWVTLLRARAIENQAYVAAANRCGADPRCAYSGRSLIIDPKGVILAAAGPEPGVIHAAVDLPALRQYRRDFAALADMRSDLLPPI